MPNDKQSLGLGFVRYFDLDVTIRAMLAYGKFIGECMDDARTTERARCAAIAERYTHTGAGYPVPVERVARDIWYAIRTEGED